MFCLSKVYCFLDFLSLQVANLCSRRAVTVVLLFSVNLQFTRAFADKPFVYQDIFENATPDTTKYRKITSDYVSTMEVDGKKILKVAPEGLTQYLIVLL